ncbi:afadin isoform X2 [Plodia interpunctella]|uniref:afadin isoform X2 n=1 Tax=Plodia interpunctella TaxID=58824 RepID=UPI0023684EE8|nr:afadin isoform X3 [Plodia interpunctella]
MDAADKRMLEREALRNMIQQWNANRLDLFELSEPNENLEFHGVMRFYFQDSGQKIATKCIRVASDATVSDVIETLIEKFRPDMRMLSLGSYSLWETHGPDDERRLEPHEKPLLVQLNWHADDREGRFLLKCLTNNEVPISAANDKGDQNFKRKLSKREKKELKKKEKLSRLKSDTNDENRPVAEKLYTELPETSFTRSISNPEAVMRRRRQQKLERKLQQFRSKDGGPDTGGTLKIYGSSLCPDVPYKTLLVSVRDSAAGVLREMLDKYGLARHEPRHYCLVQVDTRDNSEYVLEDDECPLAIVMTHHNRGSIMFHVRRRPADTQPRRRKKKAGSSVSSGGRPGNDPALVEVAPDGSNVENGRRLRITDVVEVGSGNGTALQLYGPSIQSRHCVIAPAEGGGYTVTPLHTDAHVYVNGRRTMHSQRLQHGCLLKFGRVSTFRFVDPAQETILNRNLSQSQHFGSGSIYDRSPTSAESGALSPTSMTSHQPDLVDSNANTTNDTDYNRTMSPVSHDAYYNQNDTPYNNNTLKLDNESLMMSQHLNDTKDDYREEQSMYNEQEQAQNRTTGSQYKDNYETTFDLEGNVETKSICSAKSGGSGHDNSRMGMGTLSSARPGAEAILPAVLEFPEAGQPQFLAHVITRLDPHAPAFKLAPVYTLYLCARYRASTHYRPELTPTERAHKLTAFLHHVATLIHTTVQERCTDSAAQAFWMANASELLHFLKCDRHISSFSTQAQDLLPSTVQNAFSNLVSCFQEELSRALSTLTNPAVGDPNEATGPTVQVLASAMVLLRRCRVNAALTIQLFSHLFHYINAVCFNKLVTEPGAVSGRWGSALAARLALLAAWAERQGLELAADCHLARTHQAARLIQGSYRTAEEARAALSACFKLNSVQVRALLSATSSADVVQAAVAHARALADELCRADGREIRLEESTWLGAALLIPGDGFSAEVVRGVPPGLAEFVAPLQRGGLCRLAHQPHAVGVWTVYLAGYGMPRRTPDPRVQVIQLHKNANGMGLSIVAAKGAGQSKLGIYIKSVVPGGAAALDGRLAAGDQLLSVDGQSLRGITQEKAAEYLVRTGPTVTLEIAKQGAVLHGLATLLHQPATTPEHKPAPGAATGATALRRASERDLPSRLAAEPVKPSKSTPALHQHLNSATLSPTPSAATVGPAVGTGSVGNVGMAASAAWAGKSRSSHNLAHDAFYQNLPGHNHALQDRWSSLRSSNGSNRPQSAHYSAGDQQPDSPVHSQNKQAMSARAAKLAEMSEEVSRRQQPPPHYQPIQQKPPLLPHHHVGQQGPMSPTQMHMHNQHYAQQGPMSPGPMSPGPMSPLSPGQGPAGPNMQHYHNHNQNPPQRYEWHQAGPPSPQRSQPPVAPKPQQNMRRPETETDDRELEQVQQTNNLQHAHANNAHQANNSVQPDDERYVASALEPPAVAVYGVGAAAGGGGRPAPAHNPWQREERERQLEARRQANRARRDATIAQLLSLGAARSAVQSQQLRALQLEREFERRATQHQQEDNNAAEGVEAPPSPPPSPATHPPPKSILKVNTRQDVNGYPPEMPAPQQQQQQQQQQQPLEETGAAELSSSLSQMSVAPPPPPPPARGSSFAAMAGRARALSPPLALAPADAAHAQPPQSPSSTRDKRVSFHERAAPSPSPSPSPAAAAAAPPPSQASAPPAPPSSSPPPLEPEHQHYSHTPQREDPDRFIEEAASMLSSPPSPPSAAPHLLSLSHTPGVIGAQEVYRDPRARRLAAQRASEVAGALPEQLSFKEKMKMFALESGENSTPKDKVKISRAQRDIDAVH